MRSDSDALVSVVIPIYNAETFLDQCLESIEEQTHRNLEIICVNDGSTDGSLDIMRHHTELDARVRVIDKENGGYGAACNRGIAEAQGEWISIVEPDDYIDRDMYASMLSFSARFDERIDIVKTPWWILERWDDPANMTTVACPLKPHLRQSEAPFTLAEHSELIEFHPSIWSAIYRKDFLEERGIRFPEYPGAGWADNPFLIETMCQARAILYLDRSFYRYRSDLPGATLNHATEAAVRLPFDRWETMLDIMERLGVTDRRILEAHYVRGFLYTEGAIYDDGEDNPIVAEGARRVFSRMDEDIVAESPRISLRRRKLFRRVMDRPDMRSRAVLSRIAHLSGYMFRWVRVFGIRGVISHFARRVQRRRHPESESDKA